jgi:23S rRNA (cytosine1962-C5)-methyltransferase
MKIYTTAWLERLSEISALIQKRLNPENLVVRYSRNIEPRDHGRQTETETPVVFLENGIRFEAEVQRGQKTGFFLDQRENRRIVETLAGGRTVLNAFSFSGGFSLYAARGGAKSVTDLDISAHALGSAKRNFALNSADTTVARCRPEPIQADVFEWLKGNAARKFDLIVLDPPSLAKRESERAGAIRAYGKLVESGISHLASGGILVACSCSAHVSAEEFFGAVRHAAVHTNRRFVELQTTHHAPDHRATFKEAHYLKGIYLKF